MRPACRLLETDYLQGFLHGRRFVRIARHAPPSFSLTTTRCTSQSLCRLQSTASRVEQSSSAQDGALDMQVAILVTAARHEPSRTRQERFLLKTVFTNHLSSSDPGVPRLRRKVPQLWQNGACGRDTGRDFYAAPHLRHTAANWKAAG
jgi:hypothetical protein